MTAQPSAIDNIATELGLTSLVGQISSPTTITQTYSTAQTTNDAMTAVAVATTGATNSSPYGYAQAQADAIVTNLNALIVDVTATKKLLNEIIDILQAAKVVG